MFSFFKKELLPVPEWADFLSPKEFTKFMEMIDLYFKVNKIDYQIENELLKVDERIFGQNEISLIDTVRACKDHPSKKYFDVISSRFDTFIKVRVQDKKLVKKMHDFDWAKSRIVTCVYGGHYLKKLEQETTVYQNIADEFAAVLVLDLPEVLRIVSLEEAEKWGKSIEELLTLGKTNSQQNYQTKIDKTEVEGVEFYIASAEHFFVLNTLLELEEKEELLGVHGALIAAPNRHTTLIYPINDQKTIEAIHTLLPLINYMYQDSSRPVSNKLYWYKDGHYESFDHQIENQELTIMPSEKITELYGLILSNT